MTKQQILRKFIAKARQEFPTLKAIVLWGSGATKDWNPQKSDLDLLLVLKN